MCKTFGVTKMQQHQRKEEVCMKKNLMILCMTALVMLSIAVGGFAQSLPASCGTYVVLPTGSLTAPTATSMRIAAAANFYGPVQDYLNAYLPTVN